MLRMTCRAVVGVPCRLFVLATFAAAFLIGPAPSARAQTDDFNDGNDTGWTRSSPLGAFGAPGTFTFPSGGYRIQAPNSPDRNALGPARAGSFLTGNTYSKFAVTVDLVDWDNSLNQAFGILARTTSVGLGSTDGYAFSYATGGSIDITRVTDEATTGLAAGNVTLDPARDYRLVFTGDDGALIGSVYDLTNLASPLAAVSAFDTTYASGVNGVFVFDNNSPTVNRSADATFDNFFAADALPVPEPGATALLLLALPLWTVRRRRR